MVLVIKSSYFPKQVSTEVYESYFSLSLLLSQTILGLNLSRRQSVCTNSERQLLFSHSLPPRCQSSLRMKSPCRPGSSFRRAQAARARCPMHGRRSPARQSRIGTWLALHPSCSFPPTHFWAVETMWLSLRLPSLTIHRSRCKEM